MAATKYRSFSWKWTLLSMGVFVGLEMILGGLVGEYLLARYASLSYGFLVQGLLNLVSYFIGGIAIGMLSPGLRIHEPAVGAFLCVALMLSLSFFTPYAFIQFSTVKMLVGGVIAFALALAGAKLGERLTGNRIPE